MKRKKELLVILSSLLVIVLSVSVAYFTTKILGTEKDISITSADLKVIFTSGSGLINGTNIEPGWESGENTFTVKNESNGTYKYNIIIKDLVNTFVTTGFLQYKITSTDGGYNMTDFEDVPKSKTSKDVVIAYNISIEKGVTHTYKVEFKYLKSDDVDQSADMGKTLTGKIFITEGAERPTLANQLLNDNPTISTRTDFSTPFTTNTSNTLYKATEKDTNIYYFAGADFVEAHCEYNGKIIENFRSSNVISKEICQAELTLCNYNDTLYYGKSGCSGSDGTQITTIEGKWVEDVEKPINNWVKFGTFHTGKCTYNNTEVGYFDGSKFDLAQNKSECLSSKVCTADGEYVVGETVTEDFCTSQGAEWTNQNAEWNISTHNIYWRIIRTNSDGSIRILYSGTSPDTNEGYIGKSEFNENSSSPKYVGYMYGDSDTTLDEARTNTNDSTIKTYIDNWYEKNFTAYTNYLSNDAIYCNDRELASGSTYTTTKTTFNFKSEDRIRLNKVPTYDCTNTKDAFSGNNTDAKLKYSIALMTSDEIVYAGGVLGRYSPIWYYTNDTYNSITGEYYYWWLLSPRSWINSGGDVWAVDDHGGTSLNVGVTFAVRPVTSLKSCVQWKSGDGSASNPYEIVENGGC